MSHASGSARSPRPGALLPAILAVLLSVLPCGGRAGDRERPSVEALEARTHELVNDHRRSANLPPLAYSPAVAAIARGHSEAMGSGRAPFGHEGFDRRRRAIETRIPLAAMAENVGANTYPAARTVGMTVAGWLGSAGHRENIEGDYDAAGVGIARGADGAWYYTQIFVKRKE